ncbi:hypothetical protein CDAR_379631 [Caerostris darwini]|uniref:Uncharacterized protein n=1 Tax=Caerostris darwini TaxID=1538125 RepID=A0AAV4RVA3_9ARAC|nr:hypothetical protein CDAR_379631 [Caerostris darwini]
MKELHESVTKIPKKKRKTNAPSSGIFLAGGYVVPGRRGLAESSLAPVRCNYCLISHSFSGSRLASSEGPLRGLYNSTKLIYRQITCVTVNQMSRTKTGECRINIIQPTTSRPDIPQCPKLRLL